MVAWTSFDSYNKQLIDSATKELYQFKEFILQKIGEDLRKKYVGKRVKCECFDSLIDGDEYFFDQELREIKAYMNENDKIYLMVTFKCKSMFANKEDPPKDWTLYLRSIEEVSEMEEI